MNTKQEEYPRIDLPESLQRSLVRPAGALVRLLVATDLSRRSEHAVARALELARRDAARVTLLHVVDEDLPPQVREHVVAAAKTEIDACLERLGRVTGDEITIEVTLGRGYRKIVQMANAGDFDLVVMGAPPGQAGSRPPAGTTLEHVVRAGKVPVLVVPGHAAGDYRRVMVGVDFSVYSRFAIRGAFAVAPAAEYHFVHAFHVPFEGFLPGPTTRRAVAAEHQRSLTRLIDEEMEALIESAVTQGDPIKWPFHKILKHGEVRCVLQGEVERLHPDLLVLGTHGRVGLSHAVLGSVAEYFLNHPPCELLIVKAW